MGQSGRTTADRGQGIREREWIPEELQVAATTESEGAALSGQGLFLLGLEAPRGWAHPRICPGPSGAQGVPIAVSILPG